MLALLFSIALELSGTVLELLLVKQSKENKKIKDKIGKNKIIISYSCYDLNVKANKNTKINII